MNNLVVQIANELKEHFLDCYEKRKFLVQFFISKELKKRGGAPKFCLFVERA